MSNVEKGMIIAFFVIFGVISTVSSLVGRPWSTVKNFLRRYHKRGTVENLLRTGRPENLTKRNIRTILGAVQKNRERIREQVRRIYAPHVSLHTIDRMLCKHNIKKRPAEKRPKLTADQAKALFQWRWLTRTGLSALRCVILYLLSRYKPMAVVLFLK